MHGRRSLKQPQIPIIPEIQKHCRQQQKTRAIPETSEASSTMGDPRPPPATQQPPVAEAPVAPRLLREFFVPSEYDRGSGSVGPLVGPNQYEIKAATINMLPSFYGLANKDP
ncbi:unnamed protein product [Victoria cruziana]